ncbi:type II toxin-antitoxin system CcdA family antitoxin [Burkholderia oklahomensis]|uniref:type II toxin-antitoxin system CcdA family antitoxin n=1 Tax=Burkholderia oklahomensis TaxID=342113 RepID=UPI0026523F3D|nr:type II toxin-antitoxin system CcdA family antitoxin [Burkholderia oklahomensis]MDN7671102.1 type II toxin-antitoxin system CcdA family antitoxin [Burkholderia oklahomensis]
MIHAYVMQPDVLAGRRPGKIAKATRKPTNVSLPLELLERAKELHVNISRASERGLREEVQEAEARAWAEEHEDFIAEMNTRIERDGLPLEEHRMF